MRFWTWLPLAAVALVAMGGEKAPDAVLPIVSTDWLAGKLGDPSVVVVDARPGQRDYLAAHLPGAQLLSPENLRSSARGVPGEIYPPEVLAVAVGRLGIGSASHVVVYGTENDPDAALVASVLRIAGLVRVSILDGGWKRWSAEGRSVTSERPAVTPAKPVLVPDPRALASLDDVRRAVENRGAVLLDVRPPEQYSAGRIPGAVNRFWKKDFAEEGTPKAGLFLPAAELRRQYEAIGITGERSVIVYCNSGHMAAAAYYNLRHVLGYGSVRLYDGSWLEWSAVPGLPKETTPAIERARAAADALTSALTKRLFTELAAGGPVKAVKVCSEVAPAIAAAHSGPGMTVRRVTLKTRNPADAPDAYERKQLESLEAAQRAGSLPKEVSDEASGDGRRIFRYLRPIVVGEPCLACHGPRESLDPEVRRILAERYPDDQAFGYGQGDLRGAVSVAISNP